MKANFIVKKVGDTKAGTSKTTGMDYSFTELLLELADGSGYISAVADVEEAYNLERGDAIEADLKFTTRLLPSGKLANEIRIFNIQPSKNF